MGSAIDQLTGTTTLTRPSIIPSSVGTKTSAIDTLVSKSYAQPIQPSPRFQSPTQPQTSPLKLDNPASTTPFATLPPIIKSSTLTEGSFVRDEYGKALAENYPGVFSSLVDLQTDPTGIKAVQQGKFGKNLYDSTIGTIKNTFNEEVNRGKALTESASKQKPYSFSENFLGRKSYNTSDETNANILSFIKGAFDVAFSPISAVFGAAKQVPIVGAPVKVFNLGLETVGEVLSNVTNQTFDRFGGKDSRFKQPASEIAGLVGQIAVAEAIAPHDLGTDFVKNFVKDTQTTYNLPKTVYIDGATARNIINGVETIGEKATLLKGLGADATTLRNAARDGISIEVPMEKVVTMTDKPYWTKIKEAIRLKPNEPDVSISSIEKPTQAPAGLLPEGKTPPIEAPVKSDTQTLKDNGKYIAVYGDEIDSLLQGQVKLRAPESSVKTDYREMLGQGKYAQIFRNNPNLKTPDEFATDLGMDENQLIDEMQKRTFDNTFNRDKLREFQSIMDGQELGFNPKNLTEPSSPQAKVESDKTIKRSDIAKQLSEKLNVPIRRGKFRNAGAIGIFKPSPKVVRIKSGGLPTVFHEVGHFLDDQFKFSKDLNATERQALMVNYGYKYEGQAKRQQQEGFAEFLRFKMTGQDAKALELAPKFSQVFDFRMEGLPEIKSIIDTATVDYQRWKEQPAVAKVLSHISFGEDKGKLIDRIGSNLHDFYTMALDDLHPLSEFSKLGGKVSAEKDPYILARNLRGWIGKADTFLNKGTFGKNYWEVVDGKIKTKFVGKSFSEIVNPIEKLGNMDNFRVYLVSKRIVENLSGRSITTGISTEDAKTALKELEEKHPEFKQASEDLYKYQDDLLNFGAENGLVGEEGLTKIKKLNTARVPFYRVMETTQGGYMGGKKIAGNMGSVVKKIKGSEREIIDPIESIIKDTYAIINAAERNNIGVAMANLSTTNFELGRLFEKVVKPMAPIKVNVGEVLEKAFKNTDFDNKQIPDELGDIMVTLFRPIQDRGVNMLNVNMGDQQLVFQVEPDLFKAIQGLNVEDVGMIMRVLAMPARLLRAGATLSPDFAVRNPIRDQLSAMVYSKFGYKPGYDLAKGVFEIFKKGDVYDLWKMGGGEHSMMVSLDRDYLQKNFDEVVRTKGGTAFHYLKHPIDFLRVVSEIGEQATRLGEMRNALRAGANPIEAVFASREVTLDFARIGAKTKAVNSIVAFWNASVQGMDKMIRSFKENPIRTSAKTLGGITLPSILLYLANRKDKRWKEIPQWQKDLFWIVMTKDHIYRIPKPFELGILFGSVPERILEFMDTHDKALFDELESSVANGATPGFIPTALAPVIENITNYSFFLNRPIVPNGRESLPAEAQYGNFTSEISKLIGGVVGYSPSKIDNLIQGYSGGLGKYATAGIDKVLEGTGIVNVPPSPAGGLEDIVGIKAFIIRPPVGTGSESVNRVYTLSTKVSGEAAYVKRLFDSGELTKAKQFVKEHPDIVYSKLLNGVIKTFSDINKARDGIRNSKTIDPKMKQQKILELDTLQTSIARKIVDQTK